MLKTFKIIHLYRCIFAVNYQWAVVGWAPACRSRKMLHFQTEAPPFLSPLPPVPARLTQPFTWIRSERYANKGNSQLISHLMEHPTQDKCRTTGKRVIISCFPILIHTLFIRLELPAGSGWSSRQACFSGRGSVEERACSWGRTWAPARRWDAWWAAAGSFPTGDTAWRAPPLSRNNNTGQKRARRIHQPLFLRYMQILSIEAVETNTQCYLWPRSGASQAATGVRSSPSAHFPPLWR